MQLWSFFHSSFFPILCDLSIIFSLFSRTSYSWRKTLLFVSLSPYVSFSFPTFSLTFMNRKLFLLCLFSNYAICSFIFVFCCTNLCTSLLIQKLASLVFLSLPSCLFCTFNPENLITPAAVSSLFLALYFLLISW